ncbi:hypothetical protein R3P38DRAFT_2829174 [Favolaschia claudopus]|uniref:JmjC domain-containing protein n=1 Tax=Favolaschia claudopus TaxID=2862362 RepID=A0AAW0E9N1_9AGAR
MRITSTGYGVMNQFTSPAIRNGVLPLITLDFLLHAVDPLHPAPPCPRAFLRPFSSSKHKNHFLRNTDWHQILFNAYVAHLEREKISRRPTLNLEAMVDGTKKRCLSALSMLNNKLKPGDTALYNMTQAAFMLKGMKEGKMVMTCNAFIDLALLQAHQEDPSITRAEVATVLNDPNVDGICAALAVAAAVSPVLLLSTQNYANATYNPSTSVFDYWFAGGNMPRVKSEEPLGKVERVCWIALLRLAAQTITAPEALKFIFESEDVQSIIKNKPSEDHLRILEYAGDPSGYEIEEADAYDREIARQAQEEKEIQEREKKEQEEKAEKERQKAEKEKAEKDEAEKKEKKRKAEEKKQRRGNKSKPPRVRSTRVIRTPDKTLPVKATAFEVSVPVVQAPNSSRESAGPGVQESSTHCKNTYIHILQNAPADIPERINLAAMPRLDWTACRPMDPAPMNVSLYAPGRNAGSYIKRNLEYHIFQKFALDRKMIESMIQSQGTGKPLFLEDSARDFNPRLQPSETQSVLYVCTEDEYEQLSPSVQYEIHRHRCVLMLDVRSKRPPPSFNRETLRQVRNPNALCPIQDMGLEGVTDSTSDCLVAGPLSALLPRKGRPVLNTVHLRLPHQQLPSPPGLSDFCSLAQTLTFLEGHEHLPVIPSTWGDRRWGLCSTAFARMPTHQNIAATVMTVLTGAKMVAIGVPRRENFAATNYRADLGSRFSFMYWEDVQDDAQTHLYRWEMFILEPNMAFYMRAGTPHFVISLEDTIAHGLHSINAPQIQPAVFSVLHNFVMEGFHTHVEHRAIQWWLVRMFIFWADIIQEKISDANIHYPNVATLQGFLDVLTLQSYVVLYPALRLDPYESMPATAGTFGTASHMTAERYQEYDFAVYSAVSLQRWIDSRVYVLDKNKGQEPNHDQRISFDTLLMQCIVNMACCLVRYRAAWIDKIRDTGGSITTGFTVTAFTQQLRRAMSAYEHCSAKAAGPLSDFSPQTITLDEGYLTTAFDAELSGDSDDLSHAHFMPWDLQTRPMPFSLRPVPRPAHAPA